MTDRRRLSRPAMRLLEALAADGAYASIDPAEAEMVFVRTEQRGISLGAGLFRLRLAEELARQDLVSTERTGSGRTLFRLSEAGRAFLRRRAGDPASAFQAQHQDRSQRRGRSGAGPRRSPSTRQKARSTGCGGARTVMASPWSTKPATRRASVCAGI